VCAFSVCTVLVCSEFQGESLRQTTVWFCFSFLFKNNPLPFSSIFLDRIAFSPFLLFKDVQKECI